VIDDAERRSIEADCARLIALYANLVDRADWAGAAALYADDGVLIRPTAPSDPITGRDAILAAFLARPARVSRHICANVVVDVDSATEAHGESAMLLFTGPGLPLVGSFNDCFVRAPDGWRFAERRGSIVVAG
jgi:hypothetical protein